MFNSTKSKALLSLLMLLVLVTAANAGFKNKIKELRHDIKKKASHEPDSKTVAAGLKEALSIGTVNAVMNVSQTDGYLGNSLIKIPLPEKAQKAAKLLNSLGMQKQVDEFIVSMNRAAEKAAPHAKSLFTTAVREMTFQDAMNILRGNDTAATDYLRSKTSDQLYKAFLPSVRSVMNEVGVTRSYKRMMDKALATRLVRREDIDLDDHVTSKALAGLFHMVGNEEQKIRKDPAARVTDLLKKVFASQQ